jgi:uncharacterized membrane protein YgcG
MLRVILLVLALIFPSLSYAQVSPVQDSVGLLTTKEVSDLSQYLVKFEKHIVIVIKPSNDIENDALKFGRGPNGADLVIWYSPKHDDQSTKVRIEIGTRLEGQLTDGDAILLIQDKQHFLKEKKYYDFFYSLSSGIHQKLEDKKKATAEDPSDALGEFILNHPWVLLLILVAWVILYIICPDCALFLLYIVLNSKSSSSSSSSSGDFSGGGATSED